MRSKWILRILTLALMVQVLSVQFALDAHHCLSCFRLFHSQHETFETVSSLTSSLPHSDCAFCRTAQTHQSTAAIQAASMIAMPEVLTVQEPEAEVPFTLCVFSRTTRGPPSLNL